jgi:XTP/dITP diphosphohydrolase
MSGKTLVLATRNKGKISELRELLSEFDINIKGLDEFDPIPEVEEDGLTFEENAFKKAFFTAKALGVPALADDSGLVVNALGGAPGVMSARYSGENATDEKNIIKLLSDMNGKTDRSASFQCAVVIALPTGQSLVFRGECQGVIVPEPAGDDGFGYDPVFFYPPLKRTFAQIPMEEKNRISHRGTAITRLKEDFDMVLAWLEQWEKV